VCLGDFCLGGCQVGVAGGLDVGVSQGNADVFEIIAVPQAERRIGPAKHWSGRGRSFPTAA